MKSKAYVLSGMLFGDEGKGSFVDYLTNKEKVEQIIKYNGGCQASHTVISEDDILHKFSQLGSGMFNDNCKTYLSSNMVINLFSLIEEIEQFASKTNRNRIEVLNNVYLDQDCYIVTPYHRLINRLRELSDLYVKRGSVGTGVSEVPKLLEDFNLGVQVKDSNDKGQLFKKLERLSTFTEEFLTLNMEHIDKNLFEKLINPTEVHCLIDDKEFIFNKHLDLISKINFNICSDFSRFFVPNKNSIFEGSQGLLLDKTYGIKPNTTLLDTTNINALKMLDCDDAIKVGVLKAYASRHGMGVLPTENDQLQSLLFDENQRPSFWNGAPRNGWLDAVLLRYSNKINNVDQLFLSSLDRLSSLPTINICNSYEYTGTINKEFEDMFEYKINNGKVIVSNIKNNHGDITKCLNDCKPIYIEIEGWNKDISNITEYSDLPNQSKKYIDSINEMVGVETSVVSVGPTRKEKILVR